MCYQDQFLSDTQYALHTQPVEKPDAKETQRLTRSIHEGKWWTMQIEIHMVWLIRIYNLVNLKEN